MKRRRFVAKTLAALGASTTAGCSALEGDTTEKVELDLWTVQNSPELDLTVESSTEYVEEEENIGDYGALEVPEGEELEFSFSSEDTEKSYNHTVSGDQKLLFNMREESNQIYRLAEEIEVEEGEIFSIGKNRERKFVRAYDSNTALIETIAGNKESRVHSDEGTVTFQDADGPIYTVGEVKDEEADTAEIRVYEPVEN